jgi:hypothetical protein
MKKQVYRLGSILAPLLTGSRGGLSLFRSKTRHIAIKNQMVTLRLGGVEDIKPEALENVII